jgi:S1-C subfamily serine protease
MSSAALVLAACAAAQEADLERLLAHERRMVEFCERVSRAYVFVGGGSGVSISADGWVLTNHHVAGPSGGETPVHLAGGRQFTADVIGHDPNGDVSLLKLRGARELPFLELGSSDDLEIGQPVVAVGNPFALGNGNWDPTVTFGVISAIHRFQDWYMDAIHTDAHINPGNSGGPLITLEGRVIGINGRGGFDRRQTRVSNGIGLAISASQIARYLPQLKCGGRVYHGIVEGLHVAEGGDERFENTGRYGEGVLVGGVDDGSRAAAAGLLPGDLIVQIGPYRCFNTNRFHGIVGSHPIGTRIGIQYRRLEAGAWMERRTEVVLGDPAAKLEGAEVFREVRFGFGPSYAQAGDGVKVGSVAPGGPAEAAGLLPGDLIVEADGAAVREPVDFLTAIVTKPHKPGSEMALKLRRGDETREARLKLAENEEFKKQRPGPGGKGKGR